MTARVALRNLSAGRSPVAERLVAMLFLAGLLHALVILGLTFTDASPAPASAPALEVMLVTEEAPASRRNDQATYLAQRTQLGSGTTTAPIAAGSPDARSPLAGDSAAQDGVDAGKTKTGDPRLLSSSAASADIRYFADDAARAGAPLPPSDASTAGPERSGRGDAAELTLRGPARDELRISADTRETRLAPYVAAWKRKVERVGTLNFPAAARSRGLSGSPVVQVVIGADGRLLDAQVQRSSGHAAIDAAALSILRLASPFDPFPPQLAADYRTLSFAYQWEFVGGRLQQGNVTASSDADQGP